MTKLCYKHMYVSVLLTILWIHIADNCGNQNYILRDGSACYWITTIDNSSSASNINCMMDNGTLAVIPSPEVNTEIFSQNPSSFNYEKLWIGVNDTITEGVFRYIDGRNVTWVNWANGQPNSRTRQRDCVYLHIRNSTMKWYVDDCTRIYRALCYRQLGQPQVITTVMSSPSEDFQNITTGRTITRTPDNVTPDVVRTIVPVIVVGVIIFSGLAILIVCLRNRKCVQRKSKSKTHITNNIINVHYDTIENESTNDMYNEIGTNGYDLHQNSDINPTVNNGNFYDHTNMENEYDTTKPAMHNEYHDNYDKVKNHRPGKVPITLPGTYDEISQHPTSNRMTGQKPDNDAKKVTVPGLYDEISQHPTSNRMTDPKTEIYDKYAEKTNREVSSEKSLEDESFDKKDRVYFILEKSPGYLENCYVETTDGNYDVLNKHRQKLDVNSQNVYNHIGING